MKHQSIKTMLGRSVLVAAMLALVAGSASATTYNLSAEAIIVDHGNGAVPAWGYRLLGADVDGDGTFEVGSAAEAQVPGPTIYVPVDQGLTINLTNSLAESTSIVVHGQKLTGTPITNGGRVTAFTDEALGAVTATYSWAAADLKPGTFLYNSGSHPAKQVHMGLYGAVVVDADATGCDSGLAAYPGVCYDRDIVVIYSEVDTDLRIAAGAAQALNFHPTYFLVNGDPSGSSVLTGNDPADLNSRVMLRFVNAGLKGYVPTMLGEDLEWIAEYGNTYPHARKSYSAMLSAGKTMDAIWVPLTYDRHALYDRRLHMTANGNPFGGLRAFLDSANDTLPVANAGDDQLHVAMFTNGVQTEVQLTGGPAGMASYEWALVGFPAGSTASLSATDIADPTFKVDVPGTYTAQLVVNDGTFSSAPDTVSIFTNLAPIAVADAAATSVDLNSTVQLLGGNYCAESVLTTALVECTSDTNCTASDTDHCVTGSYDPDGDDIVYSWTVNGSTAGLQPSATVANPTFVANAEGTYTVELTVSDVELSGSDGLFVNSSVLVNQPPIAGDDYFQVIWKTVDNVLVVLANDTDGDGVIDPTSVTIVTNPTQGGTAVPQADGTVFYTPRNGFKGTDYFTYSVCDEDLDCSVAAVQVNVVK